MAHILDALGITLEAAFVAYFFYPIVVTLIFGIFWLLSPSRRHSTADLFRQFFIPKPEAQMMPGAFPVFILTFIWLFLSSMR